MEELQALQQQSRSTQSLTARHAVQRQHQGHVFGRRQERDQVVGLEDDTEFLASQAPVINEHPTTAVYRLSIDDDLSGGRRIDQRQGSEQRRLS